MSDIMAEEWNKVFTPEVRAELDRKFAEVDALMAGVTHCIKCGERLKSSPPIVCPRCYLEEPR